MKKAIVPISIIVVIFVFVIIKSCGSETTERKARRNIPQPTKLVENSVLPDTDGNDITIIGTPDTEQDTPSANMEEKSLDLAKIMDSRPEQILIRKGYSTSYNKETKCPNWVAWCLTSGHTDGPFPRKGVPYYSNDGRVEGIGYVTQETCRNGYFVDLEANEPRQQLSDWTRDYNMSHGHMCPAGDNKWDKAAMNQSFLLTNMCPQDEKLNGGAWKKLEEKCRTWANLYGNIYIVAGPVFNETKTRTLGEGRIAVPDAFFKVVLCLEGTPKAIGFLYKNDSSSQSIKDCVCSVDSVEELTGFDFFNSLPDDIEDVVESDANLAKWN